MPQAPDLGQVAALVAAQDTTRQQLTLQAVQLVEQAVAGFTDWYDTNAITVWAQQTASLVADVLRTVAYMIDAYLASTTSLITGRWVRPAGPVDITALRQGITPAGAYGRVADAYRWQQSQLDAAARGLLTGRTTAPPTLQSPIEAALDRGAAVASTDVQLAARQQSTATLQAQQQQGLVTGWRRVLHPEMSRGGSCGLCIAAAGRIYHTSHLMPLHVGCHCQPVPVTETSDPGLALNQADFARLYGAAGGTDAQQLHATRFSVTENGELGPVLVDAGSKQRTPSVVKKDTAPRPRRPNTATQNRRNVTALRNGLAPAVAQLDQLAADDPSWEPFRQAVAERVADLDQQLAA